MVIKIFIMGIIAVSLTLMASPGLSNAQVWVQPAGKVNFGHTHSWPTLLDFPGACPTGQFVSGVGAVLICATPTAGVDNDWLFSGNNIYRTSDTVAIGSFPAGAALLSALYVKNIAGDNAAQRIEHTGTNVIGLFINPISGGNGPSLWANGRGRFDALVVGSVAGDNVAFNPGSGNLIVASNVGIGTTAPTEKLDVDGKARIRDLPQDDGLNDVVVADANGVLHTRDANTFGADNDWSGAGTGQMFTTNLNDKVGIGTSNPTARLEVATGGNEIASLIGEPNGGLFRLQIAPGLGSATTRIGWLLGQFGEALNIGNSGQGPIHFLTGATSFGSTPATRMTIIHNGNVGIGTQTPQSKLQVNGYIQLDLTSGTPPTTDCDSASEMGRMKVDDSGGGFLYVCTQTASGIGWVAK